MTKKLLCVIVLVLALVFVLTSCGDDKDDKDDNDDGCDHNWGDVVETYHGSCPEKDKSIGQWTCTICGEVRTETLYTYHSFEPTYISDDCTDTVTVNKVCSVCNYKETYDDSFNEHMFNLNEWITTQERTCTEEGLMERKCYICNVKETKTIPASHNYEKGVCTNCNRGLIDIVLPNTPLTVHSLNYNGSINATCKITDIRIASISKNYNGTYDITLLWSGEKTYDSYGNNHSSSVGFGYKLYDSNGYVIRSNTNYSVAVSVGEKFRDQEIYWYIDLDPNETYTLEILNLGNQ